MLHYSRKDKMQLGKYKTVRNVVALINEKGEEIPLFAPTPPYLTKKEMTEIKYMYLSVTIIID